MVYFLCYVTKKANYFLYFSTQFYADLYENLKFFAKDFLTAYLSVYIRFYLFLKMVNVFEDNLCFTQSYTLADNGRFFLHYIGSKE